MLTGMRVAHSLLLAGVLTSCASEPVPVHPSNTAPSPKTAAEYPLTVTDPWTTLTRVWLPTDASEETRAAIHRGELEIDDLSDYPRHGLDALKLGAGEPHIRYAPFTATTAPARRSLLYFAQLSDTHITDEESPVRLEGVTRFAYASAYRAQDHYTAHTLDAMIRTVNLFSYADRPLDFLFVSGDLSDNAQENELFWLREILDGGVVQADSGAIDDPVPGPGNDWTDPFRAAGVDPRVPWYAIPGNHDSSFLGTFNDTEQVRAAATGDRIIDLYGFGNLSNGEVTFGVRDSSRPFAPVVRGGTIAPDPRRRILEAHEVMAMFLTSPTNPPGHGFTQHNIDLDVATYVTQPVAGFPLTLIAMDTATEFILDAKGNIVQNASSDGEISRAVWDEIIVPALEQAQADNHLIVAAAHHCTTSMSDTVSEVKADEMRRTFRSFPNFLAHFCGHGHRTEMWTWEAEKAGEHGYVEMMQASTIDFPVSARLWELVDNGDGTFSLFSTQVEPNVSPGMPAWEALSYTAAAHNFPLSSLFEPDNWSQTKYARNMELVLPVPDAFQPVLDQLPARGPVESTGRLAH